MNTLSDIGEKKIIRSIIQETKSSQNNVLELNDDCQIIPTNNINSLVISTDRTPHNLFAFRHGLMSYEQLGFYSVVSNLSDIASMGAMPYGYLLNIAVPGSMQTTDFKSLISGIDEALLSYDVKLLGGDTKESPTMNIVGIAIGSYDKSALTRSSAQPSDSIVINSGYLGLTPTAFQYFGKAKNMGLVLNSDDEELLVNSLTKVTAKFDASSKLVRSGYCSCCMDNSDGILSSLKEICEASSVKMIIDPDSILMHPVTHKVADFLDIDPLQITLSGGADFRLIATVSNSTIFEDDDFATIGKVDYGNGVEILNRNTDFMVPIKGFEHLINHDKN